MKNKPAFLDRIIASAVAALQYTYVGYEFSNGLLRVYIDSSSGITVDDCEKVSRHLSSVLDVEDPIPGNYRLEVSSPGVDRPLFTLAQYQPFIGSRLKLRLRIPLQGQRNFTGILHNVGDDIVQVQVENELISFKYIDIEKAHLVGQ